MNGAAPRRATAVDVTLNANLPSSARDFAKDGAGGASPRIRTGGGLPRQALYVMIDVVMVCAGAATVYWLRFGIPHVADGLWGDSRLQLRLLLLHGYGGFLVLYTALIVLNCITQDLYRTPRELDSVAETMAVVKAVGLATVLLVLFIFTSGNKEVSRLVVICSGLVNGATLAGWRYAKRQYVSRRLSRGIGTRRALIVGAGRLGHELAACFSQNHELGYEVCGFLDPRPNGDSRVLGTIADLRRIAIAQFVDEVFVTSPADRDTVRKVFVEARSLRLDMHVVPDLYDGLGHHAPIRTIGGFPAMMIYGQPIPAFGLAIKRFVDVMVSAVGLAVTAPILAAAAVWIHFDSPGPIFYPAIRVGKKGRRFRCYKLRTMVVDADATKARLRKNNERKGPFFKMTNDPRVTRSGRWLRKYSVDEIPQLINVFRGDMSLVGPRPHPEDDVELYRFEDLRRLEVKPGITGLWQVTARCDPSFQTNMNLDLDYIENWSLALDMRILFKTLPELLRASGS